MVPKTVMVPQETVEDVEAVRDAFVTDTEYVEVTEDQEFDMVPMRVGPAKQVARVR